jgi:hypothetical protein
LYLEKFGNPAKNKPWNSGKGLVTVLVFYYNEEISKFSGKNRLVVSSNDMD